MGKSRDIELLAGQARSEARNLRTRAAILPRRGRGPAPLRDPAELFIDEYPRFAARCRAVSEPGLAVVAIDRHSGRTAAFMRLGARQSEIATAVVGRHGCADVYLDGSGRLSLRHLLIVLEPVKAWRPGQDLRYRVVDLRSRSGFRDEHGRELKSVVCEGAAVLEAADYQLYLLPLGDATDWPASGADAWACIPERVYFDEQTALADGTRPVDLRRPPPRPVEPAAEPPAGRTSRITMVSPPTGVTESLLEEDERPIAQLVVNGLDGRKTISVGASALDRGVLLGRYSRCNAGAALFTETVSRVHLLVIRCGDSICAIDTGSRNGTRHEGAEIRAIHLDRAARLSLGLDGDAVFWDWLQ